MPLRSFACSIALALVVAPAVGRGASAAEGEAPAAGFEVGARTGYMLPFGKISSTTRLDDVFSGAIPVVIDFGYRLDSRLYVGGFAQYAFGRVNADRLGSSPSASDYRLGVLGVYHLAYGQQWDPWLGGALAYEGISESDDLHGVGTTKTTFSGLQLEALAGYDYRATPRLAIGPFLGVGVGAYLSCSSDIGCVIHEKQPHGWLTLGLRVSFRL